MCHIYVEAPMVTNWFPNFPPNSFFSDQNEAGCFISYLVDTITCFALSEKKMVRKN